MSGSSSISSVSRALPGAPFITFYSFKGGVGRSMALFNVAGIMAGRGFRVLVIDFDLEAPGISYLLRNQSSQMPVRPGLIDLLEGAVSEGDAADLFKCTPGEVVDAYTHPYALPQDMIRHPDGQLRVLPAGRLDERYQRRLDALDLSGLYRAGHGQPLMAEFKKIIVDSGRFDLVLVDSRTGFSDESGICTRDLADHLVVVTGLNNQNIEGTAAFLRALLDATSGKRDPLFVLSPVPLGEDELMERREKAAQDAFDAAWKRRVDLSSRIYYHPRLALTEELQVFRSVKDPLHMAYVSLERQVRDAVLLTEQYWCDAVVESIRALRFERALECSRVLVKLDDSGRCFADLIVNHLSHLRSTSEGEVLLSFLVGNLPRSAPLLQVVEALHRGAHPLAGQVYERLLDRSMDAGVVGNYATFIHSFVKDIDQAEVLYRKALDVDPGHPTNLGNYALFLQRERADFDAAESYYRLALDADSEHSNNLGNYADFLERVRRNFDGVRAYYRRAVEADPGDANQLGNFARFLLAQGQADDGYKYLERALAVVLPEQYAVRCELHFYAYAHGGDRWPGALASLRQLLTSGARSPGWDLTANVQRARESGHPEAELVAALAEVISDAAPLATLEAFDAWRRAE